MNARIVLRSAVFGCLIAASASGQAPAGRGRGNQKPGPTITVRGHTFTQLSLFQRNVGGPDDMTTPFPPHKVIDNIYYVGTRSLAVFLIVTPQGNILVNSTYGRNVPAIQKSVEQLGSVTLGGTTLVAHLTPGHSRGCTTWTLKAREGGKSYDVVIIGSFGTNPGFKLVNNAETPGIAEEFNRAFKVARALPCDVPLGSHPGMYNLDEKYAKLGKGGPNPFIDPDGYKLEVDIDEAMFRAVLAEQMKNSAPK